MHGQECFSVPCSLFAVMRVIEAWIKRKRLFLDVQLTLMASSLYRLFALKIANRYQKAKSRHLFRDFIDATANIIINEKEVLVKFQKRAHNPLLIAAGFDEIEVKVPWLEKKRLRFMLG